MSHVLKAVFPDRANADHALEQLSDAGFQAERTNAEDFERPEYYLNQMPQGATLLTVEAAGRGEAAKTIIHRYGGTEVGAISAGDSSMPTSQSGEPAGGVPVAADERNALERKV
jgi:hypothetical protein